MTLFMAKFILLFYSNYKQFSTIQDFTNFKFAKYCGCQSSKIHIAGQLCFLSHNWCIRLKFAQLFQFQWKVCVLYMGEIVFYFYLRSRNKPPPKGFRKVPYLGRGVYFVFKNFPPPAAGGLPPPRPPVKFQFHNIDILQKYTHKCFFSYTNVYVKQVCYFISRGVGGAKPPEKKIVI